MELSQHNSHFWGSWRVVVFIFILSCIVGGTLIASNLFIYRSLTPFYLYLISTSVLVIFIGCLLILKPSKISFNWPVMIVIGWIAYILLHGILGRTFNPFHIYLIGSLAFLISLYVFFQIEGLKLEALFKIITIIASIEAMFCIGQFFSVFHTYNSYFAVTGSWENPNVTAMFLAMTVPIMIHQVIAEKALFKYMAIAALGVSLLALGMLECRTALIGVIVTVFIILNHRYHFTAWLLNKQNRSISILITVFFIALLIPTISYVYNAKKASADGRKLVWKLSTEMILEKPLSGYGYGLFEKNYNLFQSNYFKSGNGTEEEAQQAGFVHMGYNEFLENTVEGGLPGLILISTFFFTLILVPVNKGNNQVQSLNSNPPNNNINLVVDEPGNYLLVAYAGIVSFIVMSLFNFSLQAVPAMCLFVIYAAIYATNPSYRKIEWYRFSHSINPAIKWTVALSFILGGATLCYANLNAVSTGILIKKAQLLGNNDPVKSLNMLKSLNTEPHLYESYYITYADNLVKQKNYDAAIVKYNQAILYTSDPEIYLKTASCYEKTGQFQNAENDYLIAEYIEPNRLAARWALMQMYLKLKDTSKTIFTAQQIVAIKPKVTSNQAKYYQYEARLALIQLGVIIRRPQYTSNRASIFKYN